MENNPTMIETLFDKVETYGKTSIKLATYRAISSSADLGASLAVKVIVGLALMMFFLLISIGLALWIGKELGETFYGFFAVATIYLVLGGLFYVFRDTIIKTPVNNFIISKLKKESNGDNQ